MLVSADQSCAQIRCRWADWALKTEGAPRNIKLLNAVVGPCSLLFVTNIENTLTFDAFHKVWLDPNIHVLLMCVSVARFNDS